MALGQGASGVGMMGIIPRYLFDTGQRLLQRRKGDQALADRIEAFKPGILRQDGFAAGKIADAAVAEPAAVGLHVHVLGDHELGTRVLNERSVGPGITSNGGRVHQRPTVSLEKREITALGWVN